MIIFPEFGRLGNQILQINALRHYFPAHSIVCIGCSDAYSFAWWPNVSFISSKITIFVWRVFKKIFPRHPVFGTISEQYVDNKYLLKVKPGIIPNLYFLESSFFQNSEAYLYLSQVKYRIYDRHINSANAWLASRNLTAMSNLVFLHVRRGDYLRYPSTTSPAVLGLSWYRNAMALMREKLSNPVFIIISDDTYYCDDVFGGDPSCFVSKNSKYTDLALMCCCNHGILSASSLAFVGACCSRLNSMSSESPIFLAPENWIGHRLGYFYPPTFEFSWITYI